MARGRKKKAKEDPVVDKAVKEIHKIIDSGETDKLNNKIFDAPVNVDLEVTEGLLAAGADYIRSNSLNGQEFTDWDVKIGDEIKFFDSNLSYELTGYRPVNEEQGLDFDPEWFTEAKRIKEETGVYCSYPKGGKKYIDFWKEQYRYCNEGYISHGYRISGDNYFFLNFYRLKDITSVQIAGSGRVTGFPSFYAKQYEYFHYIELCERLKKDVCALKARGVGQR